MNSTELEIRAGESIAIRLKDMFFRDEPWNPSLATKIGVMLATIKRNAQKQMGNKNMIVVLEYLQNFRKEDYLEMIDDETTKTSSSDGIRRARDFF